jgi:hypothetical protein
MIYTTCREGNHHKDMSRIILGSFLKIIMGNMSGSLPQIANLNYNWKSQGIR